MRNTKDRSRSGVFVRLLPLMTAATIDLAGSNPSAAGGLKWDDLNPVKIIRNTGKAIEKGANDTGKAIEKGANDTGKGIEKGAHDTGKAIEKGANDTGKGIEK